MRDSNNGMWSFAHGEMHAHVAVLVHRVLRALGRMFGQRASAAAEALVELEQPFWGAVRS